MIKHIGLQVKAKDIPLFYEKILGGKKGRSFVLTETDAKNIFNFHTRVDVIYIRAEGVNFELFVDENTPSKSFTHICLTHRNAERVFIEARQAGFWTHLRQKAGGASKTYFIRDNNQNLFEIKQAQS